MPPTYDVKRETWWQRLGLLTSAACLTLAAQPAFAFKITEPAAGAKLKAGQTVTAHVDLGHDIGIVKVRYYWYREQDETLVQQEEASRGVDIRRQNLGGQVLRRQRRGWVGRLVTGARLDGGQGPRSAAL